MALVRGLFHMPVSRLRTRRDARQEGGMARLRGLLTGVADVPADVVDRLVHTLDRELSSRRGWNVVMVDPWLYLDVVTQLTTDGTSMRPTIAIRVLAALIAYL